MRQRVKLASDKKDSNRTRHDMGRKDKKGSRRGDSVKLPADIQTIEMSERTRLDQEQTYRRERRPRGQDMGRGEKK